MAYDKAKAHQYYMEYRKKGLLKGRKKGKAKTSKKGSSKKAKTESIVKASSGLTVEGTIEANNIKASMKKEMNEALKGAKTDEEKKAIIADYSKKQASALDALKKDPKYASAKAQKASASKSKAVAQKVVVQVKQAQANPAQPKLIAVQKKQRLPKPRKLLMILAK